MRTLPTASVFTRSDLRACGWSDSSVTRAVHAGRLLRLRSDQFTRGPTELRHAALAAARTCSESVVSHRSAALLHGLPLIGAPPPRPELTVQPRGTGDHRGAALHRATLRDDDVVVIGDLPVTSVARTVVDLARSLPPPAAVACADAALHTEATTPDRVMDVLEACGRWPGIRRAREVLRLVDGRSESPLESVSRLVLARFDLPRPELQARLRDDRGRVIGRCDLYWDDVGVAGEADGRAKYTARDVLIAEKQRQEDLEDLGVEVARWGWEHTRMPGLLLTKVRQAHERGRRRAALGLPRGWSVETTAALTLPL